MKLIDFSKKIIPVGNFHYFSDIGKIKDKKTPDPHRTLFNNVMKAQSLLEWNGLFEVLGINEKVVGFLPTEYVTYHGGEKRSDNVFKTLKTYNLVVENSFKAPNYREARKDFQYGLLVYDNGRQKEPHNSKWNHQENYTPIKLIHITASKIKNNIINVSPLENGYDPLDIYSLYDINWQTHLNNIENKIKYNKKLNYKDIATLKFATTNIKKRKKHKRLNHMIDLTIQDQTINHELKQKILLVQLEVCKHHIPLKHREKIEVKLMEERFIGSFEREIRENDRNAVRKALELKGASPEYINDIINSIQDR